MRTLWMIAGAAMATLPLGCHAVRAGGADPGVELSREVAGQLAGEFVAQLRVVLRPAKTTLALADGPGQPLRNELERRLRQSGFAVAPTSREAGSIPFECTVSRMAESAFRVTVRAGEFFEASRAYEVGETGLVEPLNQMTVRREPTAPHTNMTGTPAGAPLVARTVESRATRVTGKKPPQPQPPVSKGIPHLQPKPPAVASTRGTAAAERSDPAASESVPPSVEPPTRQAGEILSSALPGQKPPPTPASPVGPAVEANDEDVIVLSPDRERTIEISAALFRTPEGAVPNPFLQQYQPKAPSREMTFTVGGIVMGPHPTAVLNDRVCSVGETLTGFRVERIEAELIVLRWENFILRIPAEAQPVTVRYP